MKDHHTESETSEARGRIRSAAAQVRGVASNLVDSSDNEPGGGALRAADTLAAVSDSLESIADRVGAGGLAVRDRGRDAARALGRGERSLREAGWPGVGVELAILARRHAVALTLGGAALVGLLALNRIRGDDQG